MRTLSKVRTLMKVDANIISKDETNLFHKIGKSILKDYQLYLLCLPAIVYFIIFSYIPMYGVQIAFKNFTASKGIMGSDWVGFDQFQRFFFSYQFKTLITNTISLSIYSLIAGFPAPIILALMLNQTRNEKFKKVVQSVTYAPHFISVVVLVGMLNIFLAPSSGIINNLVAFLGGERTLFMGKPELYQTIYVVSNIWQGMGWGSIIYLAALASIPQDLYEAAEIDGANKFQTIWNIDLPSIMPTAVILLILSLSGIMNVGFQKAYLLQNPLNLSSSEIISTYVYKVGLLDAQYSYSAAIGLFNTIINIILLVTVNTFSKKLTETSLW